MNNFIKNIREIFKIRFQILFVFLSVITISKAQFQFQFGDLNYEIISTLDKSCKTASGTSDKPGNNYSGNLEIPTKVMYNNEEYTVVEIGDYSFYGNTLSSISLPETINLVGDYAFAREKTVTIGTGCKTLILPKNIEKIGTRAFYRIYIGNDGGDLVLNEGLQEIGEYALAYNDFTGVLKLPSTLITIGNGAFSRCQKFKGNLLLPDKVETIGSYAFFECESFNGELKFPDSVIQIGDHAFNGCTGFDSLVLPPKINTIEGYTFANCTGFKGGLIIPESVYYILYKAFINTGFTGELIIPEKTFLIQDSAFKDCKGLTKLTFMGDFSVPDEFKNTTGKIEYYAFQGCSSLTGSLILPDNCEKIDMFAFEGCSGLNGELKLPSNLKELGKNAFENCIGLTGILNIPQSIERIEDNTFHNCYSFTSINLPEGLNYVGKSAFSYCMELKEVIFPSTIKKVQGGSFEGCKKIEKVTCLAKDVPTTSDYNLFPFEDVTYKNATLWVPESVISQYKKTNNVSGSYWYWYKFKNINALNELIQPSSIKIESLSIEGISNKTEIKSTEEIYLTAILEPENCQAMPVEWSVSKNNVIDFISLEEANGLKVKAVARQNVTESNIMITAKVKDTEISATYTVNISPLILGDANDDKNVNVADVVTIANHIVENGKNANFCFVNADVISPEERKITPEDLTETVNIALGRPSSQSYSTRSAEEYDSFDYLKLDDFNANTHSQIINATLHNILDYVTIQAEILIPEGMKIKGVTLGEKAANHLLTYNVTEKNILKLVIYSLSNTPIKDGEGVLFKIIAETTKDCEDLEVLEVNGTLENINTYAIRPVGGKSNGTSGIDKFSDSENTKEIIYNLQGVKVNDKGNLAPGIYIINGKKVMVNK